MPILKILLLILPQGQTQFLLQNYSLLSSHEFLHQETAPVVLPAAPLVEQPSPPQVNMIQRATPTTPANANLGHGRGRGKLRGRGTNGGKSSNNYGGGYYQLWNNNAWQGNADQRVRCQLCNGWNQTATYYPNRFGNQKMPTANMITYPYHTPVQPYSWCPDTGVSPYVTPDLANMSQYEPYQSTDQIHDVNGETLLIDQIETVHIRTPTKH